MITIPPEYKRWSDVTTSLLQPLLINYVYDKEIGQRYFIRTSGSILMYELVTCYWSYSAITKNTLNCIDYLADAFNESVGQYNAVCWHSCIFST